MALIRNNVPGKWTGHALLLLLVAGPMVSVAQTRDSPVPGWKEMLFEGRTEYVQDREMDCVRAIARASASGLIREPQVDLNRTPVLRWSWRADEPLAPGRQAPEKEKDGDDFLARVYVIREGFFRWQTRAINYVWSREHPEGSSWPNPYTGNAIMVVVQSGDEGLGEWQTFERNVREDFKRYHDRDVERIDAVAVMTDADDTQGEAEACYRLPEFAPLSGRSGR